MKTRKSPYACQQLIIDKIVKRLDHSKNKRGLLASFTGTGKTLMCAEAVKVIIRQNPNMRMLFLVDSEVLLDKNLETFQVQIPGFNGTKFTGSKTAASVNQAQYVFGMMIKTSKHIDALGNFGLIFIDEAHGSESASYQNILNVAYAKVPDMMMLGCSATLHRSDGAKLSRYHQSDVIKGIDYEEGLKEGLLCPFEIFAPVVTKNAEDAESVLHMIDNKASTEAVRAASDRVFNSMVANAAAYRRWKEVGYDRKSIFYTSSIRHAEVFCELLQDNDEAAEYLSQETPMKERFQILDRFANNTTEGESTQIIVNVGILKEGFDDVMVSYIGLLRPSSHQSVVQQLIGRAIRNALFIKYRGTPKVDAIIDDFGQSAVAHWGLLTSLQTTLQPEKMTLIKNGKCLKCSKVLPLDTKRCTNVKCKKISPFTNGLEAKADTPVSKTVRSPLPPKTDGAFTDITMKVLDKRVGVIPPLEVIDIAPVIAAAASASKGSGANHPVKKKKSLPPTLKKFGVFTPKLTDHVAVFNDEYKGYQTKFQWLALEKMDMLICGTGCSGWAIIFSLTPRDKFSTLTTREHFLQYPQHMVGVNIYSPDGLTEEPAPPGMQGARPGEKNATLKFDPILEAFGGLKWCLQKQEKRLLTVTPIPLKRFIFARTEAHSAAFNAPADSGIVTFFRERLAMDAQGNRINPERLNALGVTPAGPTPSAYEANTLLPLIMMDIEKSIRVNLSHARRLYGSAEAGLREVMTNAEARQSELSQEAKRFLEVHDRPVEDIDYSLTPKEPDTPHPDKMELTAENLLMVMRQRYPEKSDEEILFYFEDSSLRFFKAAIEGMDHKEQEASLTKSREKLSKYIAAFLKDGPRYTEEQAVLYYTNLRPGDKYFEYCDGAMCSFLRPSILASAIEGVPFTMDYAIERNHRYDAARIAIRKEEADKTRRNKNKARAKAKTKANAEVSARAEAKSRVKIKNKKSRGVRIQAMLNREDLPLRERLVNVLRIRDPYYDDAQLVSAAYDAALEDFRKAIRGLTQPEIEEKVRIVGKNLPSLETESDVVKYLDMSEPADYPYRGYLIAALIASEITGVPFEMDNVVDAMRPTEKDRKRVREEEVTKTLARKARAKANACACAEAKACAKADAEAKEEAKKTRRNRNKARAKAKNKAPALH